MVVSLSEQLLRLAQAYCLIVSSSSTGSGSAGGASPTPAISHVAKPATTA
jgi:hypothetical protein